MNHQRHLVGRRELEIRPLDLAEVVVASVEAAGLAYHSRSQGRIGLVVVVDWGRIGKTSWAIVCMNSRFA